jgi:hypothetical protein
MIPTDRLHLPVLGFVRNPWSYYVSWYAFQSQRPVPNLLFRTLSSNGALDFAGTLDNMLYLGERRELLDPLVQGMPREFGNRGLNLPGSSLEEIRGTSIGFYSFLYHYMYDGEPGDVRIGRMEELRRELIRLLEGVHQPVTEAMRRDIQLAPPRNGSRHGKFCDYYDDSMRAAVARRDAALIAEFQYRFKA